MTILHFFDFNNQTVARLFKPSRARSTHLFRLHDFRTSSKAKYFVCLKSFFKTNGKRENVLSVT